MKDMMIVDEKDVSVIAGRFVFWQLRDVIDYEFLQGAWKEQGLSKKLLPHRPSHENALHRAFRRLGAKRRLVRPLGKGVRGYALVREDAHERDLSHNIDIKGELINSAHHVELILDPPDHIKADAIMKTYHAARDEIDPNSTSTWIGLKIVPWLEAVSLRERGGIYYIPQHMLDNWSRFVSVMQEVSHHKFYSIPVVRSADAVQAVLDAVIDNSTKAIDKVGTALTEKSIKTKGLQSKTELCENMLKNVLMYEDLLDTRLDNIRYLIDDLKVRISEATLTLMENETLQEA